MVCVILIALIVVGLIAEDHRPEWLYPARLWARQVSRERAMATPSEIEAASRLARQLAEQAENCPAVAAALIETEQPWYRKGVVGLCFPTDYQRIRSQVRRSCGELRQQIRVLLRDTINADLIRTESWARSIASCCRACPRANRKREQNGQSFMCLVQQQGNRDAAGAGPVRFRLGPGGQILER